MFCVASVRSPFVLDLSGHTKYDPRMGQVREMEEIKRQMPLLAHLCNHDGLSASVVAHVGQLRHEAAAFVAGVVSD